ncbi:SLATT domain-containing protein [Salinicola sp. DM10]|nr:SLATT domain-containing protein [Salinicola sp. DM10]
MTTVSRFKASERLKLHGELGMWSISSLSFALIVSSVMTLGVPGTDDALVKLQIIFSFLALILSISSSGYRFGMRSERMHDCAIELNALARLMERVLHQGDYCEIEKLRERYDAILRSYENHNLNDYHRAKYQRFKKLYELKSYWFWLYWFEYQAKFIHYYFIIVASLGWVVFFAFS